MNVSFIITFAVLLCSCSLENFDHRIQTGIVDGMTSCAGLGSCKRGNQGTVQVCVANQCGSPPFSGQSSELPSPVTINEEVLGNLRIDKATLNINPEDDILIISAKNIKISDADIVVNASESLKRIEFRATGSIHLANGSVFRSENGNTIFSFRAGEQLYRDDDVQFEDSTTCHCLYSDQGNEQRADPLVEQACSIPGAMCSRDP